MCALCAVLGSSRYWTDAAGRAEFEADGVKVSKRHEHARRVQLANGVLQTFGLRLKDWGASSYVLENAAGKSEGVYHLNGIWAAAERLSGEVCDPLDEALIARLAAEPGA
jgi:hypothetical protein